MLTSSSIRTGSRGVAAEGGPAGSGEGFDETYGGLKDTGWGRFGVTFAAEDFTELQWITSRSTPRTFPF